MHSSIGIRRASLRICCVLFFKLSFMGGIALDLKVVEFMCVCVLVLWLATADGYDRHDTPPPPQPDLFVSR